MQVTAFARVFLQRPLFPASASLPGYSPACSSVGISRRHERSNAQHDGGNRNSERSQFSLLFSSPSFPVSLVLLIANSFIRFVLLPVIFCGLIAVPKMKLATFEAPKCTEKKRSEPRKNCTPHRNITRLRIELDRDTLEEGRLVEGGGGFGNWCLSIG